MKKYERNQERRNSEEEIKNSIESLMELLHYQLQSCTEVHEEIRTLTDRGWFKEWQDVKFVLDGVRPRKYKCTCLSKFYFIIYERYPQFAKDIWSF